jgi:hypothetical protein
LAFERLGITTGVSVQAAVDDPATWFFIIGCQRSGTTLMRLVLECHSRIQCCDEKAAYAILAGRESLVRDRPLLGFKAPCLTEQFADPSWSDVLVLPEIRSEYCGQKLVFMLRDVRDTVASMLRLRLRGQPWVDVHMTPCLEAKLERDPAFAGRYGDVLERLHDASHRTLAHAAFYWRYKVDALFDYLERGFPILPVRYEDLVEQPAIELLRVPWEPALLNHASVAHAGIDAAGRAVGGTDARRAIDAHSVGQWRTAFTDDQLRVIEEFAGPAQAIIYSTPTH